MLGASEDGTTWVEGIEQFYVVLGNREFLVVERFEGFGL